VWFSWGPFELTGSNNKQTQKQKIGKKTKSLGGKEEKKIRKHLRELIAVKRI
jgi:hypothetical protein